MPTVLQPSWGHYCGKLHLVKSSEPWHKQRNCHMLHYTGIYNACYVRVESSGLRHKFGPKREEVVGVGNCIMSNCVIPTFRGILNGVGKGAWCSLRAGCPGSRGSNTESGKELFSRQTFETGSGYHSAQWILGLKSSWDENLTITTIRLKTSAQYLCPSLYLLGVQYHI